MNRSRWVLAALIMTFFSVTQAQVESWTSEFTSNGTTRTVVRAITDGSSNTIVLGEVTNATNDIRVIKYSPTGTILWTYTFNGAGNSGDFAYDMVLDASGNVYVAGTQNFTQGIAFRLNGATGLQEWQYTEASTSSLYSSISLSGDNVQVAMSLVGQPSTYAVRSLAGSNGANRWFASVGELQIVGPGPFVATDGTSNTIVVTDNNVVSYNSVGTENWRRTLANFEPVAIRVNSSANAVYVAGNDLNYTDSDWIVMRYRLDNGAPVWTRLINGPASQNDNCNDMQLDSAGNPVLVGRLDMPTGGFDATTVSIAFGDGSVRFINTGNGSANGDDTARSLYTDGSGNTFVIGTARTGNRDDVYIRALNPNGGTLWTVYRNTPIVDRNDRGVAISGDAAGNLYTLGDYEGLAGRDARLTRYMRVSLVPNVTATVGGNSVTWTARLNGTTANAVTLPLLSNTPISSVPTSVTIGANQQQATFTMTTQPVATPTTAIVSTSGDLTGSVNLRGAIPTSINLPATVIGGQVTSGTVNLDGMAPLETLLIRLWDDSSLTQTPGTTLARFGDRNSTFDLQTSPVTSNTVVTIFANANGGTASRQITVVPVTPVSVTLQYSTVVGSGEVGVTVLLTGYTPPTGRFLLLTSSNAAIAPVPSSILMPGGTAESRFTIKTQPVGANTSVVITASMSGVSRTATLNINAASLSSVTAPAPPAGGLPGIGALNLNVRLPSSGTFTASLASNNANLIVPATVTLQNGLSSTNFSFSTLPVAANTTARITATYAGVSRTVDVVLRPSALLSVDALADSVRQGETLMGFVRLNGPAPAAGAVVTLSRSNNTALNVPTSVRVPGGATSAAFLMTGGTVSNFTTVTVTATYNGVSKTFRIVVQP